MSQQDLIAAIAENLKITPSALAFLGHSQNFVCEWKDPGGNAKIVRVTDESHRTAPEIAAELNWIEHLHHAGVPVCRPQAHQDGSALGSFQRNGTHYHFVLFTKSTGKPLAQGDLAPALYRLHGKTLGHIHRVSKAYPPSGLNPRKSWEAERYFTSDLVRYLPENIQPGLQHVFLELGSALNSAPRNAETFGPIHGDLGYSNFHLNGTHLDIFDFDNCSNGYFANDIAVSLYGSVFHFLRREFPGDRSAFEMPQSGKILEKVWPSFREGYESENGWQPEWNVQLPLWIEAMYFRSFVHAYRMQYPPKNPKVKALLEADIGNILKRRPPIRFDFEKGRGSA